jgi:hypothetical protein
MRPWLEHVRNLNNNEIYTSSVNNPITWHFEPSVQVWVAKDTKNTKEQTTKFQPSLRAGLGLLWGQIDSLQDISGMFTGPSMSMKAPFSIMGASTSVNIKGGVIVPMKGLKASEIWSIFKYRYILVSPQVGVPLAEKRNLHWNTGYIMNLTEFLNVPIINPGPIQKQPGIIVRPGQPIPPTIPSQPGINRPGINPAVDFRPGS